MLCATVALLTLTQVSVFVSKASAEEDPHAKHRAMMNQRAKTVASPVSVKINDALLVTQDGKSVHFADDVIADRIVVMDFVYTTCTTVCPVLSTILGQVQNSLGERLGADVHMVSVSVDPGRDTPERLKAYSQSHRARPGWVWLTGEKTSIDNVLRGLGAYTPNFEDHPSMVLVGDARAGTWIRFFGFPGPDKILAAVEELEMARQLVSARQ
jgi:protein SCO1/2